MVRGVLGVAALMAALVGPLVYAGPQLASDLAVGRRWTLAEDLAIREFKCTRWYFLVSTCHVEYVSQRDTARVGGTLNYVVFGSWSGERGRLLRSADDPNSIGTTLGIEHLQQRVMSFGVFVVLALATLFALVRSALQSSRPTPAGPFGTRDEEVAARAPELTAARAFCAPGMRPAPGAGTTTFGRRQGQVV